jgi:hypothetical protein
LVGRSVGRSVGLVGGWVCLSLGWFVTNGSETSSVVLRIPAVTVPEHSLTYITSTSCLISPVLNLCYPIKLIPPFLA